MDIAQVIYDFAGEADIIAWVFWIIVGVFVLGYIKVIPRPTAASLMISIGIGGTFVGIFIALQPLDFAPEKINDSIKALLDGMKTAFVTSLIGIFAAVVFRVIVSIKNPRRLSQSPEHKDISDKLDEIKKAISGDSDSSMVSQIRTLRGENSEAFKKLDSKMEGLAQAIKGELVASLETLIQDLREIIAKQLTVALENLIKNIEKALIEQFGATFVQFNEAVQAIKKWQEEHKDHVEKLTAAFDESAKGIQSIRTSISEMEEKTRAIPESMKQLERVIFVANEQVNELSERLKAFSQMRESAEAAFPSIQARLGLINNSLTASVTSMNSLQQSVGEVTTQFKKTANKMIDDLTKDIDKMFQGMRNSMQGAQNAAVTEIQETVTKSSNKIRTEINREIEAISKAWADNLIAVAKECADAIRATKNR